MSDSLMLMSFRTALEELVRETHFDDDDGRGDVGPPHTPTHTHTPQLMENLCRHKAHLGAALHQELYRKVVPV